MRSGKVGGRTRKAFLAHLLPDSASVFPETKPERTQTETPQPVSPTSSDKGFTFMVTADQVALVEMEQFMGTWQRNDWQGMEWLWHQSVSLQLSGYFQAALESGLKRPRVIRWGKILQNMNLEKLSVSNYRPSLLLWQDGHTQAKKENLQQCVSSWNSASLGTAAPSVSPCNSKQGHNSRGSQKPLLSRKA